jgi:hypothetical protein
MNSVSLQLDGLGGRIAMRRCSIALLLIISLPCFATTKNTSSSQALSYAAQAMAALTGGNTISDATLTGSATWIAGSDQETGSATLYAKGTAESRVDLNLNGNVRSDIRNDTYGIPEGASVVDSGSQQLWAVHNCRINASWFFSALSILASTSDPSVVLLYVGQETRNGVAVQHLQSFRAATDNRASIAALNQSLSTMDIYLDSTSMLPIAITFNSHPDDDALTNIAIEIDFSNYQSFSGVEVPSHIQKFVNGGLALDVAVSSAVFNTNPSDSLFAIQQ